MNKHPTTAAAGRMDDKWSGKLFSFGFKFCSFWERWFVCVCVCVCVFFFWRLVRFLLWIGS
jgi:hypothetical protein